MNQANSLFNQIYKQGRLFNLDQLLKQDPLKPPGKRVNSVAIAGGAFGDEGKGRVTDELTSHFLKDHQQVIHYRDNGGANAGHTVSVDGTKLDLHQVGSGILQKGCTVISGKDMVIHPIDLVTELNSVKQASSGQIPADYLIDHLAVLSLDTHRAFESALKQKTTGSQGSTGRGIAPAYADVIYRHPLRMRDLIGNNWTQLFTDHYRLYQQLLKGLRFTLSRMEVLRLKSDPVKVGGLKTFLARLDETRTILKNHVQPVHQFLDQHWSSSTPFVFEKAQALGLDKRWGVYPDITASDCAFTGIHSSTQGLVHPNLIALKAAVIKATYTSSVGKRVMPSSNTTKLADRIRQDANEYGTTTGRPRDIHYIDLPLLKFLRDVSGYDYLIPTHLDIAYPDTPIKICVGYTQNGQQVPYLPDQTYLLSVKPKFLELPSWDGRSLAQASKPADLPKSTLQYLAFLSQSLGVKILMATTGPNRHQTIRWF